MGHGSKRVRPIWPGFIQVLNFTAKPSKKIGLKLAGPSDSTHIASSTFYYMSFFVFSITSIKIMSIFTFDFLTYLSHTYSSSLQFPLVSLLLLLFFFLIWSPTSFIVQWSPTYFSFFFFYSQPQSLRWSPTYFFFIFFFIRILKVIQYYTTNHNFILFLKKESEI